MSRREISLILILVVALLGSGYFLLFLTPMLAGIEAGNIEIIALEAQLERGHERQLNFAVRQNELRTLDEILDFDRQTLAEQEEELEALKAYRDERFEYLPRDFYDTDTLRDIQSIILPHATEGEIRTSFADPGDLDVFIGAAGSGTATYIIPMPFVTTQAILEFETTYVGLNLILSEFAALNTINNRIVRYQVDDSAPADFGTYNPAAGTYTWQLSIAPFTVRLNVEFLTYREVEFEFIPELAIALTDENIEVYVDTGDETPEIN